MSINIAITFISGPLGGKYTEVKEYVKYINSNVENLCIMNHSIQSIYGLENLSFNQ
jgi:hypothetical protein